MSLTQGAPFDLMKCIAKIVNTSDLSEKHNVKLTAMKQVNKRKIPVGKELMWLITL